MKSWVFFSTKGGGVCGGGCAGCAPIPNLDFFEILVSIWCILEGLDAEYWK